MKPMVSEQDHAQCWERLGAGGEDKEEMLAAVQASIDLSDPVEDSPSLATGQSF